MKYPEALNLIEGYLISTGIRKYCTEVCHGDCCRTCDSHQCNTQRNIACSTYVCDKIKDKRIHIILWMQSLRHISNTIGRSAFCVYDGLTDEEYKKLNESELPRGFVIDLLNLLEKPRIKQ